MTSLRSGVKLSLMKKLSTYLFLVFFSFSVTSFADHTLKKSKEESLIYHKGRMESLRGKFKNEIIKKANLPKVLKDNSKPNKKLKKIIKKSDLLSVLYFNGNEIEVNEISSKKKKEKSSKSYVSQLLTL